MLRYVIAAVAAMSSGVTLAQALTASELDTVRAFFWGSDAHPGLLEVGGWRRALPSGRDEAFGYVSFLLPELVEERLCVVESRWIEGVVLEEGVEWTSEPFQVSYDVWEPGTDDCGVKTRSDIPDHVRVMDEIGGASLMRVMDSQKRLRDAALAFLPLEERAEHKNARLVELRLDGFTYSALFRSNIHGGVSVRFSENRDGFEVISAGIYLY